MFEGLIGILILIADIYAIMNILGSGASPAAKLVWSIVVLVLPVVGLIAWYVAGPKSSTV